MRDTKSNQAWIPYLGLFMAVAGIIYQSGQLTGDVRRNTERIAKIEATQAASAQDVNAINLRTVRIESKLDSALPPRKERSE